MQAAFVIPRDQVAVGGRRDQIRNGTGIVHYHRGLRLLIRLGDPGGVCYINGAIGRETC